MNFLKKSAVPWYAFLAIGVFSCGISGACFLSGETFVLGIILVNTGQIFIGTSSYILGRISSFISIEKEAREYKEKLSREKT